MKLVTMMAKACHYAQEHIDDGDAWPNSKTDRADYLTCVSYQMACFLSQNTKQGHKGVDADVVLDPLIRNVKSETEWKKILEKIAKELGGWKREKKT